MTETLRSSEPVNQQDEVDWIEKFSDKNYPGLTLPIATNNKFRRDCSYDNFLKYEVGNCFLFSYAMFRNFTKIEGIVKNENTEKFEKLIYETAMRLLYNSRDVAFTNNVCICMYKHFLEDYFNPGDILSYLADFNLSLKERRWGKIFYSVENDEVYALNLNVFLDEYLRIVLDVQIEEMNIFDDPHEFERLYTQKIKNQGRIHAFQSIYPIFMVVVDREATIAKHIVDLEEQQHIEIMKSIRGFKRKEDVSSELDLFTSDDDKDERTENLLFNIEVDYDDYRGNKIGINYYGSDDDHDHWY